MGRVVYFQFSMIWVLFFQFSITHIQNNNVGIDIYFLLKLMIKIMCNGCVFFLIFLMQPRNIWRNTCKVVVGGEPRQGTRTVLVQMRWWRLEKCVQSCGGRRTEPGYTNSTCRLANR